MNVDPQQSRASTINGCEPINSARIGLRWGIVFWIPILLLALLATVLLYRGNPPDPNSILLVFLAILAESVLILIGAGRWWGTRGLSVGDWGFLLAGMVQGLALFVSAMATVAIVMWLDGENFFEPSALRESDVEAFGACWGTCSVWTLALGAVILWRVRRSARMAQQPGSPSRDDASAPTNGIRRFALMLLSSLGLPLLLCAPIVLMLNYDVSLRATADILLRERIETIKAQITDTKDLYRIKSELLARKQVAEALETHAVQAADVLVVLGGLPRGLQLVSLDLHQERLALTVLCAAPATELTALDLLAHNGFHDLQILSRTREPDGVIERITIQASSIRGDAS
jgi:Tfp pilus assembly protein PilN